MCGIIMVSRSDGLPASKPVQRRYTAQKSRGVRGFGYIAVENGKIKRVVRSTTEAGIERELKQETASEILFHHRLPTSTPNVEDSTHPIVIKNKLLKYNYYFVHNGVIQNDEELRLEHESLGFDYQTLITTKVIVTTKSDVVETSEVEYNDSEALAIDIALFIEGFQDEIRAVGTIAFVCYQTNKRNKIKKIFYGRNYGSPLEVEDSGRLVALRSEGGDSSLPPDILYEIDYASQALIERDVPIGKVAQYRTATSSGMTDLFRKHKDSTDEGTLELHGGESAHYDRNYDEEYEQSLVETSYASVYGTRDEARKKLDEVEMEIELMQNGIKKCVEFRQKGVLDSLFDETYEAECVSDLSDLNIELWELEEYLELPSILPEKRDQQD